MAAPELPLSGAAIAALQRQAENDMRLSLAALHQAQIEMIGMAVNPAWVAGIDMAAPGGDRMVMPKGPDPRLAAEKLLRSVLPEDLCVSLSAIGECEVQGKKHRYKIFKNQKTHCVQAGKTFSCCIGLSDTKAPDTDRIIAEYLLILNNEDEYLKTANLTQIAGPREELQGRNIQAIWNDEADGHAFGRDWLRENTLGEWPQIGATINIRRPPQYRARTNDMIPPRMITEGILMNLRSSPHIQGRRWPVLRLDEAFSIGLRRDFLQVPLAIDDTDLTRTFDELNARVLRVVAEELAHRIAETPNIEAFFEVQDRYIEARTLDHQTGIDISYARHVDIRDYQARHVIIAGILLR